MNRRTVVPPVLRSLAAAWPASAQDLGGFEIGLRGWMGDNKSTLREGNPGGVSSTINTDSEADAGDLVASGFVLNFLSAEGGHRFFLRGWQASSNGSKVLTEDKVFGSLILPTGAAVDKDSIA